MKRIVLFSQPTEKNIKQILDLTFPKEIKQKVFAYMPSDGANCPQKYIDEWKTYASNYQTQFLLIDNSKTDTKEEQNKLLKANILVISGGNTYILLQNLRRSGLLKTLQEFIKKEEFVISGFSAGAIVLTPTINICNIIGPNENSINLKDLTGLNIIDFEVFPHYSEGQREILTQYKQKNKNKIKTITNDEFLVINH